MKCLGAIVECQHSMDEKDKTGQSEDDERVERKEKKMEGRRRRETKRKNPDDEQREKDAKPLRQFGSHLGQEVARLKYFGEENRFFQKFTFPHSNLIEIN